MVRTLRSRLGKDISLTFWEYGHKENRSSNGTEEADCVRADNDIGL